MDFYVIPPLSALELMNFGDRFFCLAQLYLAPENYKYREFFKQKVADGKWVTLDNGAGDHDIVSTQDLLQVMQDLKPSEIIPPDFLFDSIKTIRSLETFTRTMCDLNITNVEVLGCPQGATKDEWLFTYEYMLRHPAVNTIGLSKIAVPRAFLSADNDTHIKQARHLCFETLRSKGLLEKPLHLLGMGDPTEFRYYKGSNIVRSTDSCNTIWSGMNGIKFNRNEFDRVPTPKDYFNRDIADLQYQAAISNIHWMRKELSRLDN